MNSQVIDPALIRHAVPERILTPRLVLARDAVADAAALRAAVTASHAQLAPWLSWVIPVFDLAEAVRTQRRAIEYWDAGDSFQWRLWWRAGHPAPFASARTRARPASPSATARPLPFVGSIDLHTIDWAARTAELGYWLHTPAAGLGLMAEAGPHVLRVAFELLGFTQLTIRCHPDNTRSLATARRLGFTLRSTDADGAICLTRTAMEHRS